MSFTANADATFANKEQSSYTKFLSAVKARATYGNSEFVALDEKLHGITATVLKEQHATWHRSCYSLLINKEHLKCNESRFTKACATADVSRLNRKRGRPSSSLPKLLMIQKCQ